MTIIYNTNKNYKNRSMLFNANKRLSRHNRRKWKCFVYDTGNYLGHIKFTFLLLAPIFIFCGLWLVLFGKNISADYRIYSLKQELKQRESQINNLNEQIANITSREKIIEWAELNNFVKVNTISYLDLSNKNLAQR